MPILIDNERITINELEKYSGSDGVKSMLKRKLKELNERFFNNNRPIVFRYRDGMLKKNSAGFKEGKKSISIKWAETVNTDTGSATVIYCENINKKTNGSIEYMPKRGKIKRSLVLDKNKIELALFYYAVCSVTSGGGIIVIEDKESDAKKIADKRAIESSLDFYLYNSDSPLYEDKEKLVSLAYSWGIPNAKSLSTNMLKNRLRTAVKNSKSEELSIESFISSIKGDSQFTKSLAMIQKAIDSGILLYSDYQWIIKGTTGGPKYVLLNVSAFDNDKAKHLLAIELNSSQKKYDRIKAIIDRKNPIDDKINFEKIKTEDDINILTWEDFKNFAEFHEMAHHGVKRTTVTAKILAKLAID